LEVISGEERDRYFSDFRQEALHLEMRDAYGTQTELPHLAKWLAGEPDDKVWLQPWLDTLRAGIRAGKVFRRLRIVSEPVSDYIRWEHRDTHLLVDAGEDIRWLPRRLVSALTFPGNDFWLFDEETVVFTVFAASGLVIERQRTTDPAVVQRCKASFEAAWPLSVPHHEYTPA